MNQTETFHGNETETSFTSLPISPESGDAIWTMLLRSVSCRVFVTGGTEWTSMITHCTTKRLQTKLGGWRIQHSSSFPSVFVAMTLQMTKFTEITVGCLFGKQFDFQLLVCTSSKTCLFPFQAEEMVI